MCNLGKIEPTRSKPKKGPRRTTQKAIILGGGGDGWAKFGSQTSSCCAARSRERALLAISLPPRLILDRGKKSGRAYKKGEEEETFFCTPVFYLPFKSKQESESLSPSWDRRIFLSPFLDRISPSSHTKLPGTRVSSTAGHAGGNRIRFFANRSAPILNARFSANATGLKRET